MAVVDEGLVLPEEIKKVKGPLNSWDATADSLVSFVQKIPGANAVGRGVKRVASDLQQPGPVAHGLAALENWIKPGEKPATAEGYRDAMVPPLKNTLGMLASILSPQKSMLQRLGYGSLIPMLEDLVLEGNITDPKQSALKGVLGLGTQGATEGITGAVKQLFLQKAAKSARNAAKTTRADYDLNLEEGTAREAEEWAGKQAAYGKQVKGIQDTDAVRTYNARVAHSEGKKATLGKHETQVVSQEAAHLAQKGMNAADAATAMMDQIKAKVPAYSVLPSDLSGLTTLILGKGPQLLSAGFAKSMKEIVHSAGDQTIRLPIADLRALKVPILPDAPTRPAAQLFDNLGRPIPSAAGASAVPGEELLGTAYARDVAEAVTGHGAKDWQRYRRIVNALDEKNIGDPQARAEFKDGFGFTDFVGKAQLIEVLPEGSILHTDRVLKAMGDPEMIDILRKRSEFLGDVDTGVMQEARTRALLPPKEIPKPPIDEFIPPPATLLPEAPVRSPFNPGPAPVDPDVDGTLGGQIASHNFELSRGQRAGAGAAAGSLLGYFTDGGNPYHFGAMGATGLLAGGATPGEWITKAPGTQNIIEMLNRMGVVGGAGVREKLIDAGEGLGIFGPSAAPQQNPADFIKALKEGLAAEEASEDDLLKEPR